MLQTGGHNSIENIPLQWIHEFGSQAVVLAEKRPQYRQPLAHGNAGIAGRTDANEHIDLDTHEYSNLKSDGNGNPQLYTYIDGDADRQPNTHPARSHIR
jgi:hypothetical protein